MPDRHAAHYGMVISLLWRAAPCAKPEGLCGATRTQATCSSAGLTRPSTPPTSTTPQAGARRGAAPAPPSVAARVQPRGNAPPCSPLHDSGDCAPRKLPLRAMLCRARCWMNVGGCAPREPRARAARRYFGSAAEAEKRLPFDAGFEAVGVVAAVGPGVEGAAPPPAGGRAHSLLHSLCRGRAHARCSSSPMQNHACRSQTPRRAGAQASRWATRWRRWRTARSPSGAPRPRAMRCACPARRPRWSRC